MSKNDKPKQSMRDFFAREDVKAAQAVQKTNPCWSAEWKAAELKMRELAREIGAENFFGPIEWSM